MNETQCRKANYPTPENAKKAMQIINNNPRYIKGKKVKHIRGYYLCKKCGNYHLTSMK